MSLYYRLDDDGNAVPCSFKEFDETGAFAIEKRRLHKTEVGIVRVSTVFLGIDHNFYCVGPPILWETMIFGGPHDQYQHRCSTREEALEMHRRAVALAFRWFGIEAWLWTAGDFVRILCRRAQRYVTRHARSFWRRAWR